MFKRILSAVILPAIAIGTLAMSSPEAQASNDRAYVMMLEKRTFGKQEHIYVAIGQDRKNDAWNLPGGNKEKIDPTRGAAAARELYEETASVIDKRGDKTFWSNLSSYEYGKHKVFITEPGALKLKINVIDSAVKKNVANPKLHYTLREMKAYTFIKLTDLIACANQQTVDGKSCIYKHPNQGNMTLDGWMLYTLKHSQAAKGVLSKYNY